MKTAITIHPNQELFTKAKDIPVKDIRPDTFSQIGSSMLEILKSTAGVGLSANQVGLSLNMCVVDIGEPRIMLNPRVIKMSDRMIKSQEGCLSLPGVTVNINRHKNIIVEYEDVNAETITLEATGLLANCLQHEMDHLNGILVINRLTEFAKSKALKQLHKFKRYNGRVR